MKSGPHEYFPLYGSDL